ncbi:hypothetical protein COCNU_05G011010 [Cocos nucifera]|uniref:DNA 3'-5' helicase n=1 Tax=Cocos nucifera TaxID=13894 RepID=A0A8K0I9A0_COCNU|nr:hypothetical protein COCNU_05G011010 [Cocos nucifera]
MKLGSWGINCLEMTGDKEFYEIKNIQEADVILTTPEKFDAVTRHGIRDGGLSFFSDIALVLIDEVHLLNDTRGAALEAVISRIKMLSCISEMSSCPLSNVRFLAVSATIPNIEDLAEWLLVPPEGIKRFGEEMRPVKLMTKVHLYENLLNGCEMVESQLLSCAIEHLNAEIVQMTVSDISMAIEWLKCSYLYVRIKKNPENYGIKRGIPRERLEKHLREPGRLMTKFYLKFETMKLIVKAPGSSNLEDVLQIICRSEELSCMCFLVLSMSLYFGKDMNSICLNGCRIAKCMKECFIYRKSYKGAIKSILLAKCFHQKLWDDSPFLLKQLPGIGMVTAKALNSAGINSFESMIEADPRKIEIITGRKYPFGNHIKESLLSLPPKVEMQIKEVECKRQGKSKLIITLTRVSHTVTSSKHHFADMSACSPYVVTLLVSCPQNARVTVKADLIFEEYDLLSPEHGETESKTKKKDMIFDHIRKKSKNFPTLLTSKAMDSSHQPLILTRKGAPQANNSEQNEIEVHLDNMILIDSEPTDASPKSTKAVSSSMETKRSCKKTSGSSSSISDSVFSSKFTGDSNGGSENNKLTYDDPPLEGIKMVGCKRAFPIELELDPVPKRPDVRQHRSFEPPGDRREVSFLGFKSVFSFL